MTYSVLKSVLEGRPGAPAGQRGGVRHLQPPQPGASELSDRRGDEVDINETVQEKTSLAERFGLRIPFTALNRNQFLEMVEELAQRKGVCCDREVLRAEAVKWEMRHPSRTPHRAPIFGEFNREMTSAAQGAAVCSETAAPFPSQVRREWVKSPVKTG